MIKKLLFAGALALAFNSMNAQVQVWKDDFNDQDSVQPVTYLHTKLSISEHMPHIGTHHSMTLAA